MATSRETFDQVRNILKKLDRSIDDARRRRLEQDTPATPERHAQDPEPPQGDDRPLRAKPLAKRRDPLGPWQDTGT